MVKAREERGELEKLLQTKEEIQKRISKLKEEADHLETILRLFDTAIAEKSFTNAAEIPNAITQSKTGSEAYKETISLKSRDGVLLAKAYIGEKELKAVPTENMKFNLNTPPFQQFLVNKVLTGMAAKDREEAMKGELNPDHITAWDITQQDDLLKEITVKNIRDERRMVTLRNSIRWTLEKMYERTKLAASPREGQNVLPPEGQSKKLNS